MTLIRANLRALALVVAVLMVAAVSALAAARSAQAEPSLQAPVRLQGTYLQLHAAHRSWQPADWEKLFGFFRSLGFSHLVLQWTMFDGVAFDEPGDPSGQTTSALDSILALADEHGMAVLIGLNHEASYWEGILGSPASVAAFLQDYRARAFGLAQRIRQKAERHSSFHGWYLPEEVEDGTWIEPAKQEVLIQHLQKLSEFLHSLTPGKPVALSGFSNGELGPAGLQRFWATLLARLPVDVLLFQDGIGTHKLTLEELPAYVAAVDQATEGSECRLWLVTEVFRQVAGAPINEMPFRAVPGPIGRIAEQMKVVAPFSEKMIAFSAPEYMTPLGGFEGGVLFEAYKSMLHDQAAPR